MALYDMPVCKYLSGKHRFGVSHFLCPYTHEITTQESTVIALPRSGFPSSCFEIIITTGSDIRTKRVPLTVTAKWAVQIVPPSGLAEKTRGGNHPPTLADHRRSALYFIFATEGQLEEPLHDSSQGCRCLQLKTLSIIFPSSVNHVSFHMAEH